MNDNSKSYRIRTTVGADSFVSVGLEQDYDTLDILSLKIKSEDVYRLHNSTYGVIVGRVLANNGFGVPNAKISIFIERDPDDGGELSALYPYTTPATENKKGVRYNLLPDEKVSDCHQVVGTFPNKRYLLDNEDIIEMFEKYYKYTTRTNNAGDYMICGVPTGNHTLHMDLDLSDCGILSQRPRDFVYKGYTIEQFENPNMFKKGTAYSNLSQIFTQDQAVYVQPFWGNESLGETIGITRADINIAFKFEPTCVFMGSIASDNSSQGISKKCIPTPHMGDMDELTTGEGTIEMIRKTYAGDVEEFQVKGTELINGDGIWCYQIPMNLDYMMTDEYGNMVPTDNPDKGIPTRTRVRFRISMQDMEKNTSNYFRPKVLVPHNPQNLQGISHEDYDYEFGTYTKDDSFRDLLWNGVYTVKSYIPRFQKRKVGGWKEEKFSGIKHCQDYGKNNPIPYNNIRIRLPFMFKVMCTLIKIFIKIVSVINTIISMIGNGLADIGDTDILAGGKKILNGIQKYTPIGWKFTAIKKVWNWITGKNKKEKTETGVWQPFKGLYKWATKLKMNVIEEGLCPDLENWYFAPMFRNNLWVPSKAVPKDMERYDLLKQTLDSITNDDDPYSIDDQNQDGEDEAKCLTVNTDYLIACIEMNLAQEYRVINFDFYNDWINGLIYIPRFMRYLRKKRKFLGITMAKAKIKGCMDDSKVFAKTRRYTQMCSIGYKKQTGTGKYEVFSKVKANTNNLIQIIKSNNLHKKKGLTQVKIFGKSGGICHEKETMRGQHVYYLKPCEWVSKGGAANRKVNLYATDLVLLGSLNDCDLNGIPQAFKHLASSSYIMPTNLALTNMEENGPLYAYGDNGTMCSKSNQTTEGTNPDDLMKPVRIVSGNTPLADELKFYSGASSNYDVMYDDASDTIALTEAAGIAWNYSGPGQGAINKRRLYYPGGHFLGLSCVNSQTNVKSCVNLERICEMGASMSQRKEDVRAISENEGEAVLEYTYNIPTGLISGDDIIDDEFRVMFATLNKNRLIVTKTNPSTGYKVYDFSYVNPVNFSGELSKYTTNGSPYNTTRTNVTDESEALSKYGIEAAETRDDYDPNEALYSIRRTVEFPSVDYYMFRLGLSYDDLKPKNARHLRQFAKVEGGAKYLPQYENSFYFYFGTRDGATALDEFNKQFFSECEDSTLIERETASYIEVGEFDYCAGTAAVTPHVKNLEGEISYVIERTSTHFEEPHKWFGKWDDENAIEELSLPAGAYIIRIMDEEGTELSSIFTVDPKIGASFSPYDFNIPLENGVLVRDSENSNMYYGGYLKVEDIHIGAEEGIVANDVKILILKGGKGLESKEKETTGEDVFLASSNTVYDVYLGYRCTSSSEVHYIYGTSITLLDSNSVDLTMGPVIKTSYKNLNSMAFTDTWWEQYNNKTGDNPLKWNIRKSIVKANGTNQEVHDSRVEAVNGVKALFGTPQNSSEIYPINDYYTSEQDSNIPEGYTLDDEVTYYETYGCPGFNKSRQYNAIAYNGLTVCGKFAAIVTGGSEFTKDVRVVGEGLRVGEGCLFKPLPDGDIVPAIFNGNTITCLADDFVETDGYNEGIVYPTIKYPVIRKPFTVHANYFIVQSKQLEGSTDDNGDPSAEVITGPVGTKCESHIFNGLTYNHYYGGDSRMTIITDDEQDEGYESAFRTPANVGDLDNITSTTSRNTESYFKGWSDEELMEISFSIQEGAPMYSDGNSYSAYKTEQYVEYADTYAYQSAAETAELNADFCFHTDAYFEEDEGELYVSFDGVSDSDIEYFIVPLSSVRGIINENSDKNGYIFLAANRRTFFILGHYTDKATNDVEGKDVVVKLYDPKGLVGGVVGGKPRAVIPFTVRGDGDETTAEVVYEEKKVGKNAFDWNIWKSEIGSYVDEIKSKFKNRVDFEKERLIEEGSKVRLETDAGSWTNIIESVIQGREPIPFGGGYTNCSGANGKYVVIGKKTIVTEGVASANVYNIYMYPIRRQGIIPPVMTEE